MSANAPNNQAAPAVPNVALSGPALKLFDQSKLKNSLTECQMQYRKTAACFPTMRPGTVDKAVEAGYNHDNLRKVKMWDGRLVEAEVLAKSTMIEAEKLLDAQERIEGGAKRAQNVKPPLAHKERAYKSAREAFAFLLQDPQNLIELASALGPDVARLVRDQVRGVEQATDDTLLHDDTGPSQTQTVYKAQKLQADLELSECEKRASSERIEALCIEKSAQEERIAELEAQLAAEQRAAAKSCEENSRLVDKLHVEDARNADMQVQLQRARRLDPEMTELRLEIQELQFDAQTSQSKQKELQYELEHQEDRYKAVCRERDLFKKQVGSAQAEVAKITTDAAQRLRVSVEEYRQKLVEIQDESETARAAFESRLVADHDMKLRKVKDRLAEKDRERHETRIQSSVNMLNILISPDVTWSGMAKVMIEVPVTAKSHSLPRRFWRFLQPWSKDKNLNIGSDSRDHRMIILALLELLPMLRNDALQVNLPRLLAHLCTIQVALTTETKLECFECILNAVLEAVGLCIGRPELSMLHRLALYQTCTLLNHRWGCLTALVRRVEENLPREGGPTRQIINAASEGMPDELRKAMWCVDYEDHELILGALGHNSQAIIVFHPGEQTLRWVESEFVQLEGDLLRIASPSGVEIVLPIDNEPRWSWATCNTTRVG